MYYAYSQRTIFNTVTMDLRAVTDDYMFSEQAVITFKYMINNINDRPFYLDAILHLTLLILPLQAIS
jgi:hypothetical protein